MSHNYQKLESFINEKVLLLCEPFEINNKIVSIANRYKGESGKPINLVVLNKVFNKLNDRLEAHKSVYYSHQSIDQLTEQIFTLWEEESENQLAVLSNLKVLDLPISLQSDYKLHSINDILEEVQTLPKLKVNNGPTLDATEYLEYDKKRQLIVEKVNRINRLRQKKKVLKTYHELILSKVGKRQKIQQNIPNSKNQIYEEVAKLKIVLQKLKNLDDIKRKTVQRLLSKED